MGAIDAMSLPSKHKCASSFPPGAATIDVTEDAFLGGAVMAWQPRTGYRAGVDAVLLAASLPNNTTGARILDAGAGVGVVGLCVARRLPGVSVTLVEREPALANLAVANVFRNNLDEQAGVLTADILARSGQEGLKPESFDVVLANPPFYDEASCRLPRDPLRARAHAMSEAGDGESLDGWLRAAARLTKPGGQATMIHRADALGSLLAAFANRFGDVVVTPIHPRVGAPAHRILVSGRKGSRGPTRILSGIVLHGDDGGFRPEIGRVLRGPVGLDEIV